jgi:hypothetical protein
MGPRDKNSLSLTRLQLEQEMVACHKRLAALLRLLKES